MARERYDKYESIDAATIGGLKKTAMNLLLGFSAFALGWGLVFYTVIEPRLSDVAPTATARATATSSQGGAGKVESPETTPTKPLTTTVGPERTPTGSPPPVVATQTSE